MNSKTNFYFILRGDRIYVNYLGYTDRGIKCRNGAAIHHLGGLHDKRGSNISRISLDKIEHQWFSIKNGARKMANSSEPFRARYALLNEVV